MRRNLCILACSTEWQQSLSHQTHSWDVTIDCMQQPYLNKQLFIILENKVCFFLYYYYFLQKIWNMINNIVQPHFISTFVISTVDTHDCFHWRWCGDSIKLQISEHLRQPETSLDQISEPLKLKNAVRKINQNFYQI